MTSLRFFAALAVVVCHGTDRYRVHLVETGSVAPNGPGPFFLEALHEGYSGVAFFFVLSGFVLTYNYAGRLAIPRARSVGSFYLARFARVYPLHPVTLALGTTLLTRPLVPVPDAGVAYWWLTSFTHLTLTQAWVPFANESVINTFNAPSWSLACEAFFYLLTPAFLWALACVPRWRSPQLLLAAAVPWSMVLVAALAFPSGPDVHWFFYYFPPVRLADFIVGVCVGAIFLRMDGKAVVTSRDRLVQTVLETAAVAVVVVSVLLFRDIDQNLRFSVWYTPGFAVLVFVMARGGGLISALLSWKVLVYLGETSFGLYMLHFLVFEWQGRAGDLTGPHTLRNLVLGACIAIAASGVLYALLERPARERIRRRGERWLSTRTSGSAQAVPAATPTSTA